MKKPFLSIEIKEQQNNFVISIVGSLTISNIKILKDILFTESFTGKNVIFDLKDLEYIDSSGIGLFFVFIKSQKENNKNVKLDNLTEEIKEILIASGLYGYYEGNEK